jgi:hypothetical protein
MIFKNKKNLLLLVLAGIIGYIVYDSTSQPSVSDLKGNFKEVAVFRNANNTGPIVRVYAVTAEGTPWDEMKKYGDLMPYTKYGSTKVYFFGRKKPFPQQLDPAEPYFDTTYNSNCLAVYTKDANGQVSFTKTPFSN